MTQRTASVGYDIRTRPGFIILCAERWGSQITAPEAEDIANRLLEAAKIVRKHNTTKPEDPP